MASDRPTSEILDAIRSLQRLTDLFRERRRELARGVGLNEAQWRLLEEIAGDGFMPSLFARQQDCAPAAVSRTLRQLLERDLVCVSISPDDARQRVYRLTSDGRRLLRRLNASRERAIAAIWKPLPRADLANFVRFAEALADGLEAYHSGER
jgi:DNA-binding MarR family transcriptional regulator